jgi:hypothetical protein
MSQATDRAWVIEGRRRSVGGGEKWEPLSGIEPRSLTSCTADLRKRANMPPGQSGRWRMRNVATRDIINWPMPGDPLIAD